MWTSDEDRADVLDDGSFADDQSTRDRAVGSALGHQRQHLAFPVGQPVQWGELARFDAVRQVLPVCAGVDRHHGGGWTRQRGVPPTRIVCGVAHQRPDVQGVVWLLGRNVDPLTQPLVRRLSCWNR